MSHASWRNPAHLWPGVLFVCIQVAACNGRPSSSAVTESDSAGVRLLTSRGVGWGDESTWHLELDLDVGAREGPFAFARLRDVAQRRGGGLWVLDGQAGRVRGFDNAGRETLAFGRRGQGPGEFTFVNHVAELPDGELVVGGSSPIALHRFGAEGVHRSSIVLPDSVFRQRPAVPDAPGGPAGPTFGKWRVGSDGSAFVQTVVIDGNGESIARHDVLFRLAPGGGQVTRLAVWNSPLMEGGPSSAMRLLQPDAAWSPLPDGGIWFTAGRDYDLRQIDAMGRLTTVIRRPIPVHPVTDDIRRGVQDRLRQRMDNDFEREFLDRAVYPEDLPATFGLWVSDSPGVLWVGVVDHGLPWNYEVANAWDVFEQDGTYMGRLPIPEGFKPTRVTTDHVYGIWLDDLDVPHARRYRIVRSGP